ncbi:unnamed protein product [Coffea canephora]|uniref:Small ribosomal subunit protein uS7 domain-containing protein n=1 Tax=Coffea canephora TaxID=49390 RepID=A0A068V999_COFCA|nr:unnamed protein product [Coffea canephora]
MIHGRNDGKKLMDVRIVKHATEIIHLLTDSNPIQTIVDAVINNGPREDATRIGSAGVVRRQAVDISPLRRVNQAIYLLTTGARESAFRNIKTITGEPSPREYGKLSLSFKFHDFFKLRLLRLSKQGIDSYDLPDNHVDIKFLSIFNIFSRFFYLMSYLFSCILMCIFLIFAGLL